MKRTTQNILYHTLPIVFWLLAGAVCFFWYVFFPSLLSFIPSVATLIVLLVLTSIKRRASSVEECLWTGILLGVASYWLPTVLFLLIPAWIYLYYRRLLDMRSFLASLIGVAIVAIWVAVLLVNPLSPEPVIANPWAQFFAPESLWCWIPVGAVLLAYIASSVARNILKVR